MINDEGLETVSKETNRIWNRVRRDRNEFLRVKCDCDWWSSRFVVVYRSSQSNDNVMTTSTTAQVTIERKCNSLIMDTIQRYPRKRILCIGKSSFFICPPDKYMHNVVANFYFYHWESSFANYCNCTGSDWRWHEWWQLIDASSFFHFIANCALIYLVLIFNIINKVVSEIRAFHSHH